MNANDKLEVLCHKWFAMVRVWKEEERTRKALLSNLIDLDDEYEIRWRMRNAVTTVSNQSSATEFIKHYRREIRQIIRERRTVTA